MPLPAVDLPAVGPTADRTGAATSHRPRPAMAELPPGAIRPAGWLHDQLRLQADGLTGRLPEVWPDVGPESGWLGGPGESWERGPYYLDGLLPLAYALDDHDLIKEVRPWVEWLLGSQRPDGWFGPADNDDWWPRMIAAKVLTQHHDATGDERVLTLLSGYFRYQLDQLPDRPLSGWGRVRGADNVLSVLWLHRHTGEDWLLDLADLILEQTEDWGHYLTEELITGRALSFDHRTHGVNVAMGLKTDAVRWLRTGDDLHRRRTEVALAALERWHGQAHGWFSGDEFLGGREATAGVETCLVVELMFTLEQLAAIFGEGVWADRLESVAYNLLPASCDPRMLAHQYHQQANQVRVSVGQRPWTYSSDDANLFGLEPHFGCCTANLHQGWPKLARSLWMRTDTGLAVISYAPCTVTTTVDDLPVRLAVQGSYPFESTITIAVDLDRPTTFGLALRIPAWCREPSIAVLRDDHSEPVAATEEAITDGYLIIDREWQSGDRIELELPMEPRVERRERQSLAVRYGALTMVAGVPENWIPVPDAPGLGEWEIHPRSSWNHGIVADPTNWRVEHRPVGPVPFSFDDAPVRIRARGARIPGWGLDGEQAATVPEGPVPCRVDHEVTLVPYGSARLRVTELPTVVLVPDDRS